MESPKFIYQPADDDESERWLNEGGHAAQDYEEVTSGETPSDQDDASPQQNTPLR